MKRSRKIRITIIVLSVLLAASLFALAETYSRARLSGEAGDTAVVEDNFITTEKSSERVGLSGTAGEAETACTKFGSIANSLIRPIRGYIAGCYAYAADNEITLSGAADSENVKFNLDNMFPGDSKMQVFRVKIKHSGKVKVHCEAVVDPTDATSVKSAEAMRVKVKIDKEGEPIYDGEMLEMPESAVYTLTGSGTTELKYEITAYMATSVSGEEFMDKTIKADFKWWLEEVSDGHGGGTVKPTDPDKDETGEDEDGDKDQDDEDKDEDKPSKDDKKDDSKDNKDDKDSGKKGSTPKTGDSSDFFLWIGLAALTGGGSIFLLAKKRQKEDDDNA